MAGHSKFKNIMHRKGAQDKKRAKVFGRLIKELTVAARSSTDPDSNPRLRSALAAARAANMPKDNIERVLKRAEGGEGENYDEIRYEGYGPGGTALIVDAMTDNRNRTASEVRAAFNKFGGSLGETGSVSFMFDRVGEIIYLADVTDAGMCGDYDSVIGMDKDAATDRFLGRGNSRLLVALGPVTLSGVIVETAETGLATAIYPLRHGGVLSSA